ncbi:carbohydrate ABC transporter permease [Breznakiella homolactica]|uniref:Sugar ABC transporter permease n=1 Tax=Breznakiella homolactica TaxID=2798577 RepID=A0A7T7XJD1_9SPIR|nr:sugar ABC transporter permease [Breznakiella homolactica]QQO07485.1 sugar ABC transporter permease [Breznakiella homolactica]
MNTAASAGSAVHRKKRREKIIPYLFTTPAFSVLLLFLVVPACMAVYYSLTYFNMLRPNSIRFIGIENYIRLFQDKLFFTSIKNTFYYALVYMPLQCVVGLSLAMLVNQGIRGTAVFRMAYFSPMLTSMTVVAILWTFIYNPTPGQGLINTFIAKLGFEPIPFLRSADTAMNSIVATSVWQSVGQQMMIFLAGLQNIPAERYEAASIDGASGFQKFRYVTLPSLRNVFVFVILMTTIAALKMFTQSFVMTAGGPDDSTRTIVYYIYQQGITFRNVGYASAASVVFFFLVVTVSFIIKRFTDKG